MRLVVALLLILAAPAGAAATAIPTEIHPVVVGESRISAERLERWARTAIRLDATREAAVEILISNRWVELELARRGEPDVTRARAVREARRMRRQAFSTRTGYRRFLRRSGQTHGQILYRVRSDLRQERLWEAEAAATGDDSFDARLDLGASLRDHWLPLTRCAEDWFVASSCATSG